MSYWPCNSGPICHIGLQAYKNQTQGIKYILGHIIHHLLTSYWVYWPLDLYCLRAKALRQYRSSGQYIPVFSQLLVNSRPDRMFMRPFFCYKNVKYGHIDPKFKWVTVKDIFNDKNQGIVQGIFRNYFRWQWNCLKWEMSIWSFIIVQQGFINVHHM